MEVNWSPACVLCLHARTAEVLFKAAIPAFSVAIIWFEIPIIIIIVTINFHT